MAKIQNELLVVQDYQQGMTWDNICKKYNTNLHAIHKILKKHNVSKTRMQEVSWSQEKQNLLTEMYLNNCTYKEMYEALNCKGGTLTYWIKKLELPMRGSGRKNNYINRFLENTIESNYWLGYIFADGHISYNPSKRRFTVELSSEKEYVVTKFKEWYFGLPKIYSSPYILKDGTKKTMYKAVLMDRHLAEWFNQVLKIDNVKHHTLDPDVSIDWDIIRGFFDGDGSAAKNEWQMSSCSKKWLTRIKNFLNEHNIECGLKLSYLDCWRISVYDKKNLCKLVPLMYENKYYCHEYKYKLLEPYMSNHISQTE